MRDPNDFAIVTSYYNPMGYETRRVNYDLFISALSGLRANVITIECAFPGQAFALPPSPQIIQVKSESVLWQRERLVNLVNASLPLSIKSVAWVDCDLLFTNVNWISDAMSLLDRYPIAQLFERCIRLPKGHLSYQGEGKISTSFASVTTKNPAVLAPGSNLKHGITGGAWAARCEVIEACGLYEYAIVGGADDYLAHAVYGDFDSDCVKRKMEYDPALIRHYREWAELFYSQTRGMLGVVPGDVLHLWHGELDNRKYFDRHKELHRLGYNPYLDIVAPPGRPLEWSSHASVPLRNWFYDYFRERKEDG
ncbi:MAG: hypothetical protein ABSC29_01635 [Minisyncoccia bacterium]|jgi:hypothetical protein